MKKFLTTVLLLTCIQIGYSQQFAKSISKSNEDIENPKKKDNPKTWIERAELMRKIYDEPTSKIPNQGITEDLLAKLLNGEQPLDIKEYVVEGETLKAIVYRNKEVFVNSNGVVLRSRTTKTEIDNPLDKALEAYKKAAELGGDAKKIKDGLSTLSLIYTDNYAMGEYYVENYAGAVEGFKKSLECSSNPVVGVVDTNTMYNVGFVAMKINDYKTAEEYYTQAANYGYVLGGNVYGSIYEAIVKQGAKNDTVRAGEMLMAAYKKYPASLSILGHLINHYVWTGGDPQVILPILRKAQEEAPTNASLFSVEGDMHMKLNDEANAMIAYEKAIKIDPNSATSHYRIGSIYAGHGDDLFKQANEEPSVKKSNELYEQARAEYKKSIPYYEAAYNLDPNEPAFSNILQNLYFRLRYNGDEEDPEMMANYNKYKAINDNR